MSTKALLVFDKGGGITLHLGHSFAHHYTDVCEAARVAVDYFHFGYITSWEGNEIAVRELPSAEQPQNGGYRMFCFSSIRGLLLHPLGASPCRNERDFFLAVFTYHHA
jgi:hypothetical protein